MRVCVYITKLCLGTRIFFSILSDEFNAEWIQLELRIRKTQV
jgi:hypothetical protein